MNNIKGVPNFIEGITLIGGDLQLKIITSLVIIIILWVTRKGVHRVIVKWTDNIEQRYNWIKTANYIIIVLGAVLVGRVWFQGIQSIATFLGLLSAGLAIALSDVVKSMAGWIYIIVRRPFSAGDRIQIGKYSGDVIDILFFKFTLMEIGNWVDADQSTGRLIHIPNNKVLTEVIANYGQGFQFIWNEIPVLITFESDWRNAKKILTDIANKNAAHQTRKAEKKIKEAAKKYMIFQRTLAPTVYTTVKDSGVLLTIRYLINPRYRRISEQAIWEDILTEFKEFNNIDFAYPTQRFYDNNHEGKKSQNPKK